MHLATQAGFAAEAQEFIDLVLDRECYLREKAYEQLDQVQKQLENLRSVTQNLTRELKLYHNTFGVLEESRQLPLCPVFARSCRSWNRLHRLQGAQMAYGAPVLNIMLFERVSQRVKAPGGKNFFSAEEMTVIFYMILEDHVVVNSVGLELVIDTPFLVVNPIFRADASEDQ